MFGREVSVVARATVVAAAAACASAIGLAGAAIAGAVSQQTLVGAWSGPAAGAFGDTGECGTGSAEVAFSPDGTYRYRAIYPNCDPVMIDGHYELQSEGGVLHTSPDACGYPGCPPGVSPQTTPISGTDPDSFVLDGQYTYGRQHG